MKRLFDWVRGPGPLPKAMLLDGAPAFGNSLPELWMAYRMRWKRRRLLLRAWRKRKQIAAVQDRTGLINPDDILGMVVVRNEMLRLPHFLDYHRKLGVDHFLIIDNASNDGTAEYLAGLPDVSLWTTSASYKLSRFGVDWITWLQRKHAHGHWCLTLDADELFVYRDWPNRDLKALTRWLDARGEAMFGTIMLDMYPKGPLGAQIHSADTDPIETLGWFDATGYRVQVQPKMRNLWIQGGVRARCFFASEPARAPTLNKIPLVRWNRGYVYVNSTHALLPRKLNRVYAEVGRSPPKGVLLHTKFLPNIADKSTEELNRRQHFANSELYEGYYAALIDDPDLWSPNSLAYHGWEQLEALGFISDGD